MTCRTEPLSKGGRFTATSGNQKRLHTIAVVNSRSAHIGSSLQAITLMQRACVKHNLSRHKNQALVNIFDSELISASLGYKGLVTDKYAGEGADVSMNRSG